MKNELDWEKFEPLFGTWASKIKPFFDSGGFTPIYKQLKKDSRRGKRILPLSTNTYRCFTETPLENLKVVLVGMSPYHTLKNGEPIADGLLMGCSTTNYLQPSLEQFYNALEEDLYGGLNVHYYKDPDVSYLAKQGVLMLNAALTTELYKAGNHFELWESFMKFLFENIISPTGVPIVFLGRDAAKLEKYTAPFTWVFKLSHPASAAYNKTEWHSNKTFSSVNKVLHDMNGYQIKWLSVPDDNDEENGEDDLPF